MKKTRILLLGGLAIGATTLGSMTTLIACKDKQAIWLKIDSKTIDINDGRTGNDGQSEPIEFIFKSSVSIAQTNEIKAEVVNESEDNGFKVTVKDVTHEDKQIHVSLVLSSKEGDEPEDIYDGTHAKFDIKLTMLNAKGKTVRKQTVSDFLINFSCTENHIEPVNGGEATCLPRQCKGKLSFKLNGAKMPNKDSNKLLVEISDKEYGAKEGSVKQPLITDVSYTDWEVSEDQKTLIVWFDLAHEGSYTANDGDWAKFNVEIRCVDAQASNNVYWDYKTQSKLKLVYSEQNSYFDPIQNVIGGGDHLTGVNQQEYEILFWNKLSESDITFSTEIIDDEQKELYEVSIVDKVYIESQTDDVPDLASIKVQFNDKNGNAITADANIHFKVKFNINRTVDPIVTADEDSGECIFCYRSKKLKDITEKQSKWTELVPDPTHRPKGVKYNVELRDGEAKENYTYKFFVRPQEGDVKATGQGVPLVTGNILTSTVGIQSETTLKNGDKAAFGFWFIAYDENGIAQWWEEISSEYFEINYRCVIHSIETEKSIVDGSLDSGCVRGTLNVDFGAAMGSTAEIDPDSITWNKQTVKNFAKVEISKPEWVTDHFQIPFALTPTADWIRSFDSFIDFSFKITAKAPDPTDPTNDNIDCEYLVESVKVTCTSNVVYMDESWYKETQPGDNFAMYHFKLNESIGQTSLDKIDCQISNDSQISTVRALYNKAMSSYDPTTRIFTACIELHDKETTSIAPEPLFDGDIAAFDIRIYVNGSTMELPATLPGFYLKYTSVFTEYERHKKTNPTESQAVYKFTSKTSLNETILECEFAGQKPDELMGAELAIDPKDDKTIIATVTKIAEYTTDEIPVSFKLNIKATNKSTGKVLFYETTNDMSFTYLGSRVDPTEGKEVTATGTQATDPEHLTTYAHFNFKCKDSIRDATSVHVETSIVSSTSDKAVLVLGEPQEYEGYKFKLPVAIEDGNVLKPGESVEFTMIITYISASITWTQTITGFKITYQPE